jgi:hypothetical protein
VVPQVVQTCEHRKYASCAGFSTRVKTKKLGKTLGFYHSDFFEFQIVDTRKPAQTLMAIGFAGDGL